MAIEIHSQFKLNGFSFDKEELKEVGYSLVKEGNYYEQTIGDFLIDWCNDYSSVLVRTSGSTGSSKLISLKKQQMVNSALATAAFFELEAGNTVLHCLPTEFIAGKMMLVRAMVLGLELDFVEPTSSPLDLVSKTYDFCAMVPLQVINSLRKLDKIKTLIVGGAPVATELKEQVQDKRTQVYETYGMTETITHVAVKSINNGGSDPTASPKIGQVETSFKTLPRVKVSTDERDCLIIDAPHLLDAPIVTNDVVKLISENEFEWLGRFDNIINSGGIKLIPEQIEAKLAAAIENRFFATGIPDAKLGQKLILVVEGNIDVQVLLKKMKSIAELEKYEIPKAIFNAASFVEAANGKVLREASFKMAI